MSHKPFFHNMKPFAQLMLFAALVIAMALFFSLISILIIKLAYGMNMPDINTLSGNLENPRYVAALKTLQIISQLGIFVLPPFIFAFLTQSSVSAYFKFTQPENPATSLWAIVAVFTLIPLVGILAQWNMSIDLPESMSRIEQWMKNSEEQNRGIMEAFLNTSSATGLLVNLFMIAVLPAIGEELLFRGVVQQLFRRMIRNGHIAIILTAILFSAFHMQFFGFFPRFLLGLALGYAFYFSGNIWMPILMHFVNNAFSVVAAYYYYTDRIQINYNEIGYTDNTLLVLLSILLTIYVFYRIRKNEASKRLI